MAPYRSPARVRSQVLDRLARSGRELPRDGERIDPADRRLRIALAYRAPPNTRIVLVMGTIIAFGAGVMTFVFSRGEPVLIGAGCVLELGAFILALSAAYLPLPSAADERRLDGLPFPVDGYLSCIVASEPTADVHFAGDVDRDQLGDALRAVGRGARAEWLDPRTVRIALPTLTAEWMRQPWVVADRDALWRLLVDLLEPLAGEVEIAAVDLGGHVR